MDRVNEYVAQIRAMLDRNRGVLAKAFTSYGMELLPTSGAYYMLLKHHRESDIAAMEELIQKKIVVTPVNILTSDPSQNTGYIRIHFAVSELTAQEVADILLGARSPNQARKHSKARQIAHI